MDSTRKTREELLSNYGQIINGLCSPDEFVDMVMEDIITNTSGGIIKLDYDDVKSVLHKASVVDAVRFQSQGKKTELRQKLDAGLEKLTAAHPQKKVCALLLQITGSLGGFPMEDFAAFPEFISQFDNVDTKKYGMANRSNPGEGIYVTMIVGFK